MSDCEISLGAGLIRSTQDIEGATPRSLIEVIRDAPLKLEDVGGGPHKTASENDAAFETLLAHFDAVTHRGTIQLLEGTYQISQAVTPPTFARNLTVQGYGSGRTSIRQSNANENGFSLPAGLNTNVTLREFLLYGAGTGTSYSGIGKGIYQPDATGNDSFSIFIDRIWVYNWGSDGVFLGRSFSSSFNGVRVNYVGGHGIVGNGNTVRAVDCYMANIPGVGKAGYRFYSGQVTLENCNGLDSGETWGRFGRSTALGEGDGADEFCLVTLIGCNLEDYTKIGFDLRNGIAFIDSTTSFTGAANAPDQQAIRVRSHYGEGTLGSTSRLGFKLNTATPNSTWMNGKAIHALGGNSPFSNVMGAGTGTELSYWDESVNAAKTMPINGLVYGGAVVAGAATRYFRVQSCLFVPDIFKAGGGVHLSGLTSYTDDAAAAADGALPSKGVYLVGTQVRVKP